MTDWQKPFSVLTISRQLLKEYGLCNEWIIQLTDEDIQTIATELRDLYTESGFSDMVLFSAMFFLVFKKQ